MVNLPQFTRRQWATAAVIAFADFCSAVCVSLQAPFYPAEVAHSYSFISAFINQCQFRSIIKRIISIIRQAINHLFMSMSPAMIKISCRYQSNTTKILRRDYLQSNSYGLIKMVISYSESIVRVAYQFSVVIRAFTNPLSALIFTTYDFMHDFSNSFTLFSIRISRT